MASRRRKLGSLGWYAAASTALNGVKPALYHDYANNRYYNSADGVTAFPFTSVRSTNATQFDSLGRLVWAPANMFPNGSGAGGTASSLPTGWITSIGAVPGGTVTVVGMRSSGGVNYMQVRYQGVNDAVLRFPTLITIVGASAPTAVLAESYTGSYQFRVVEDVYGNFSSCQPRCEIYELTAAGAYLTSNSSVLPSTSTLTRVSHSRVLTNASVGRVNAVVAFTIQASVTFDFTIEVGEFQLERTSVSSPLPYVSTTTAAVYKQRLFYNSATLASWGVFSEGAATNLVTYSRDKVANATLTVDITGARTATDVSGVANAAIVVTEGSAGTALITDDSSSVAAGATVTTSHLFKSTGANPVTWVRIGCVNSGLADGAEAWFNIATGALGSIAIRGAGTLQTHRIFALRDGWYRLEVTAKPNAGYTVPTFFICSATADGSATRVNNATYAIDYAQMETGTAATSIIPTFAATATRAADSLVDGVDSWFNQANGTWFLKFIPGADVSVARRYFGVSDGSTNNLQAGARSSTSISQSISTIAGVGTFGPNTANASTAFAVSKVAHQFSNAPAQAVCLNGGTVATSAVAVPTSGYTLYDIGKTPIGLTANLNGWIQEVRYYPAANASGAQLQALTT